VRPAIAKPTIAIATSLQTTQGKKINSNFTNTNKVEENNNQEHQ
jgi:hypothetical protein